ncbi:hypothetical protein BH20CHL5_BH20CHL5_06210 [soil metagenome]
MAMTPRLPCLEFTAGCINLVDIYYPENPGPWPVIVTIHGRPRTPADMRPIARELASRGAVVYNADFRGVRPVARGFPESVDDVSCAVRFARATASEYGGDEDHLVLVGHSQGGYVGSLVSLSGDEFLGRPGACLADEGGITDAQASLPDGFVHVAGVSIIDPRLRLNWIYFGGSPAQKPRAWRRGEIYDHIGSNPELVVGIIFERDDPILGDAHATRLHAALRDAGYDVRLRLMDEGDTHFDILEVPGLGQRVVRMVEDVVDRTR